MSVRKTVLKSRPAVKVRFKLDATHAAGAEEAYLAGSFNDWDNASHPMKKNKDGSFSLELELQPGEDHKFRYCLDCGTWVNDPDADAHEYCDFAGVHNSVVKL